MRRGRAAGALRDDALGPELTHRREELQTAADTVIDRDEARAAGGAEDVAQQCSLSSDRARAQIVAVEMEKVEGEIGEHARLHREDARAAPAGEPYRFCHLRPERRGPERYLLVAAGSRPSANIARKNPFL